MQTYYIYEIVNNLNGKTYVGQRHCPLNRTPWTDKKYMGGGMAITSAEKKYGIENFSKSILAICYKQNILDILEKEFISFYKSIGKAEYNIAPGGHPSYFTFNGGSRSEEGIKQWKDKITALYKSEEYRKEHAEKIKCKNFYDAISTEEYKKKLSNASKRMWSDEKKKKEIGKKVSLNAKGIHKSDEAKRNISKAIRNSEKFKAVMASEEHKKKLSNSIKNSKKHWNAVHSESFLAKCRENAKHRTPAQIEASKKFAKSALGKQWFTSPDGKQHLIKPEDAKPDYICGRVVNIKKPDFTNPLNIFLI